MQEYERRRDLIRAFARPRKIVKVGNSVGLMLSKELFRVGQVMTIEVLDGHGLRLVLEAWPVEAKKRSPTRKGRRRKAA